MTWTLDYDKTSDFDDVSGHWHVCEHPSKPDCTRVDAIENIDIGGPAMLRAAAKNHAFVTVVVDPADYDTVVEEIGANSTVTEERTARQPLQLFSIGEVG